MVDGAAGAAAAANGQGEEEEIDSSRLPTAESPAACFMADMVLLFLLSLLLFCFSFSSLPQSELREEELAELFGSTESERCDLAAAREIINPNPNADD